MPPNIIVRSAIDIAILETAEEILIRHGVALQPKYPLLSEKDMARLILNVMAKLSTEEGLRRLKLAGSPPGFLAVVLENSAANLAAQHRSAFLAENLALLTAEEKRVFALAFVQKRSIGEIASDLGLPYANVAAMFFRLLRRMREDRAFRLP